MLKYSGQVFDKNPSPFKEFDVKKNMIPKALMVLALLSGCSTSPYKERVVASKEFECRFSETINGEKTDFVFTPDALKLSIAAPKAGSEMIYLEEDNFVSGGFTYTQAKGKVNEWAVAKVEFISYAAKPKVTVNFNRTPASKKFTVTKDCAL